MFSRLGILSWAGGTRNGKTKVNTKTGEKSIRIPNMMVTIKSAVLPQRLHVPI